MLWLPAPAGESSQMTPRMMIGCGAAILGFCLYSHAKLMAARAQAASAAAGAKAPLLATDLETPLLTTKASLTKAAQHHGEKAHLLGPGAMSNIGSKRPELPPAIGRTGSNSSLIKAFRIIRA
jgi:hypothetical protein